MPEFYEFFAGGGMARAGLGDAWKCVFANDIDEKKVQSYRENWGGDELLEADVADVNTDHLPGHADLCWASFPCQDLSVAGAGEGLGGARSGTFWPFWDIMKRLRHERRSPRLIVLENVPGAITSHAGEDFRSICKAMMKEGYTVGAVVIDAVQFVPQSRKRLFIIGFHSESACVPPESRVFNEPDRRWHPERMICAVSELSAYYRKKWVWLSLPEPRLRAGELAHLIEKLPQGIEWHGFAHTGALLEMMEKSHRDKVSQAVSQSSVSGETIVGTIYRRTRKGVQRAEVRFDGISGCLRTAKGGSSRQTVMVIQGNAIKTRLLSPREAARLMGLNDSYILPQTYNEAYTLAGDGVVVPVVRYLASSLLERVLTETDLQGAEQRLTYG